MNKEINVQKEKDGTFIAFLKEYPNNEEAEFKAKGWVADTEEDAVKGLMALYPNVFDTNI